MNKCVDVVLGWWPWQCWGMAGLDDPGGFFQPHGFCGSMDTSQSEPIDKEKDTELHFKE